MVVQAEWHEVEGPVEVVQPHSSGLESAPVREALPEDTDSSWASSAAAELEVDRSWGRVGLEQAPGSMAKIGGSLVLASRVEAEGLTTLFDPKT